MNECRVKDDENNVAHMTYLLNQKSCRSCQRTLFQTYKLPFPAVPYSTQPDASVEMEPRHASVPTITGRDPLCAP